MYFSSLVHVARFSDVYNAIKAKGVDLYDSGGQFLFQRGALLYEAPFAHGLLRLRTVGAVKGFFQVSAKSQLFDLKEKND